MKLVGTLFLIMSSFFTKGQGYGFEGQGRVLRDTGGMWTKDMSMEEWGGKVVVWEDLRMCVFNDCCEREVFEVVRDSVVRKGENWYQWVVKGEKGVMWKVLLTFDKKDVRVSMITGSFERVLLLHRMNAD